MKFLIATFCSFITFQAIAGEPLVFSPYSKSIQFVGENSPFDAQFKGEVKVTGVLSVDFERNEAYFFPNEQSLKRLPNVIQGSHPKNAEAIFIGNGKKLLNRVLSKNTILELLVSRQPTFESAAVVTIKNLRTQVVCDTREYDAELVSITIHPKIETEVIKAGYGC